MRTTDRDRTKGAGLRLSDTLVVAKPGERVDLMLDGDPECFGMDEQPEGGVDAKPEPKRGG